MIHILSMMKEMITQGEDAVLVTITASSGATPRGLGSHMLVDAQGLLAGTIGGGMVEYRSIQMAQEALQKGESLVHDFRLKRNEIEDLGMICGGEVTVDFRLLRADDPILQQVVDTATDEARMTQRAWLIARQTEGEDCGLSLLYENGDLIGSTEAYGDAWKEKLRASITERYQTLTIDESRLYIEEIQSGSRVLVFGGGHVAQALVPILVSVGFHALVFEDREEFASKDLFPDALAVKRVDFKKIEEAVTVQPGDYVCVMTRGHASDEIIQDQVLHTEAKYIGVIGSKNKKAAVDANLHKRGHSWENIARIVSPIGLDLGGRTPEEIAISITAELISVRAGRKIVK